MKEKSWAEKDIRNALNLATKQWRKENLKRAEEIILLDSHNHNYKLTFIIQLRVTKTGDINE